MSSSQSDSENSPIKSGPLECGRCNEPFENILVEELDGVYQVRVGNMLFQKIDAHCMKCGWKFSWNMNERQIQEIVKGYGEILQNVRHVRMEEDGKVYIKLPDSDKWIGPVELPFLSSD